ncbi:MAG: alpha/beta hydrolase [Spirochaetales bacterium]|nr:alpha/beta hydrolase [Spirochaetales bacterium]
MASGYDRALLRAIREGESETLYKGVKVLVKPIPEGGKEGDSDPRLAKAMRFMPLMLHFIPKPKKNASLQERIAMPRKMFSEYKGLNLVSEGVNLKHVSVKSSDGHDVPVRIYTRTDAGADLPMLVYYHGGGFSGGSPDIVDQMCRLLVRNIDSVVVNVDYRLCPEAHYPQPLDDCWAATCWAYAHARELGASGGKIAVSGDSAGGNLAAAVTLRDREEKTGMIGLQALIYPAVNIAGAYTEFYRGTDPSLYRTTPRSKKGVLAMYRMMNMLVSGGNGNLLEDVYLQGNISPEHIYASPILDDFHALPPTLLAFGEHDFLAFEDFAYARHAVKADVRLRTIIYRGLGHGFADQIGVMPQAEDLIEEIARMMKEVL